MLVSHRNRFIYLKTQKTAGTSVEIYFERYCLDPTSPYKARHLTDAQVSPYGIIGYRGPMGKGRSKGRPEWYNHMPAELVREQIGPQKWSEYTKFCAIRNPYDKAVSYWWHMLSNAGREAAVEMTFDEVRKRFSKWVCTDRLEWLIDRNIYTIDGELCVDFLIRYEHLVEDMEKICAMLNVEFDPTQLGKYKNHSRVRKEPFPEYFDFAAAKKVTDVFAFEFDRFGYPHLDGVSS
jgi:hypothetical protein